MWLSLIFLLKLCSVLHIAHIIITKIKERKLAQVSERNVESSKLFADEQ